MDKALEGCVASICTGGGHDNSKDSADSAFYDYDTAVVNGNGAVVSDGSDADSAHVSGSGLPEEDARVTFLHDFVSSCLPKSRHQVLTDASSSLVLSVHHPNAAMRVAAIAQLGRTLGAKDKVRCVQHGVHALAVN